MVTSMRKAGIKIILIMIFLLGYSYSIANDNLMLFCGAAFKRPVDELIMLYMKKNGIKVNATYSGMGALYSQILFSRRGDVFIVPSPDLMQKAKSNKMIYPDSIVSFAYIAPVINVKKGNPKKITELADLARPGVRIALGNPKTVFIGALAVEIIDKGLNAEQKTAIKKNLATYAEDFAKLSFILRVGQVDAIVGLHYLSELYPDEIDAVKLKPEQIYRIGSGQAAILSFSKNMKAAREFIDFIMSAEGQNVFKKYHYFSTREEADGWIGTRKPVGGEYQIPDDWFYK
jgi:molybdate transport system substrate-binding protein